MDATGLLVSDIMTTAVTTIDPNDRLIDVDRLAGVERIRHFPVVDEEGELVGVVSQRDIFHSALIKAMGFGTRAKEQFFDSFRVKEVMRTEVRTIEPSATVEKAAQTMADHKVGCLPVLDAGSLAGIVTETDIVRLVAQPSKSTSERQR